MKLFLSTLMLLAAISASAATIVTTNPARDPRVITIKQAKSGRLYFKLCSDNSKKTCELIGRGGFTPEELSKKVVSERNKAIGKGAVVVVALGSGAYQGILMAQAFGAAVFYIGGAAALTGGGTYSVMDLLGRSPLEHNKARNYLNFAQSNAQLRVKNIDDVYDLYAEVLSEVERSRLN